MKIIILGAGLAGLVAGRELSRNNDITILEKAECTGGLASSFEINRFHIPKFYHHIIASNDYTIKELERYNLLKEAVWKPIKMSVGLSGRLYNVRRPVEFRRMPGLSLGAKLRLGLFGLYSLLFMNPSKIADTETAEEYLYRHCGKEATDFFWWNLYGRNKFNIPLSQISAKQFIHRLAEKEFYDKFTYPPSGLQSMIDGLEKTSNENGAEIRLNTTITEINLNEKKVVLSSGETIQYDIIVSSIPMPEFVKVAKGLPENYRASLERIRYCPAVCLCFATKKFLKEGVYWINFFGEHVHLLIQHSILMDKYGEKISWVIRYGGSEEDINKPDNEIKKLYLDSLRTYFPDMEIKWCKVFKTRYAEPVWDSEYYNYSPAYQTPIPSLFMTGVQVMFPKIRNQNTALESGFKVAEQIQLYFS